MDFISIKVPVITREELRRRIDTDCIWTRYEPIGLARLGQDGQFYDLWLDADYSEDIVAVPASDNAIPKAD